MKLNHSITIIITSQILFVHLYTVLSSIKATTASSSSTTTTPTTTITNPDQEDDNYFEVSEESKRIIIEQAKASLLKVLGLKEVPKTKPKNKAIVPYAMFEEYRNLRDSVRETIPEDRDYYGKLNVHDLEKRHVDFWDVVYNKYPGYDIEIDMDSGDPTEINYSEDKRFLYKGDYERLSFIRPQSEPEDVPKKYEHTLPPHYGAMNSQNKPFISVHLRFNLSQELFTNPISVDELQAAELHLSREKIVNNNYYNNDDERKGKRIARAKEPYFDTETTITSPGERQAIINDGDEPLTKNKELENNSNVYYDSFSSIKKKGDLNGDETVLSTTSIAATTSKNRFLNRARYQRLYLLHVLGYDNHNEPITRIHDSQIIDTHQSTPLMLDIYLIVKRWIQNPVDNYGIIIRITNDDKNFEQRSKRQPEDEATTTKLDEITNASTTTRTTTTTSRPTTKQNDNGSEGKPQIVASVSTSAQLEEHVRLKRGFRSNSEIDEVWYEKQPSIYIFSSPPDFAKRHVKRNTGVGGGSSGRSSSSSARSRAAQKKTARTAEKCGKKTLLINFDEVGWSSWIIAPQNYFANYCLGDCSYPMNDIQNATNHAIIQSIFHSVGRVVPRSCCAPTKLGKMAILYQLDGVVQMRHYDDMIVESCGCV